MNGVPLLGQPTGVGYYGRRLLATLMRLAPSEGLARVGVYNGRSIVPADVFLASSPPSRGRSRLRSWIKAGVPGARWIKHRWTGWQLNRRAKAGWNVLHEPNFVSPRIQLPMATTVHDLSFRRFPQFMPADRLAWLTAGFEPTMRASRVILADSQFTAHELLELYPQIKPEKIHVARLGVDRERFCPAENDGALESARQRLNLPRQFVLYLGTLEPRKNVQGLLAAYSCLPAALQHEWPLVLAGAFGWQNHWFDQDLERLCQAGLIRTLGYVPQEDVPWLMRTAGVFCFPSFYEGFGLPPLEAAACGTPVLAGDTGCLREVLGKAAAFADPHDSAHMAQELRGILEDPHRRRVLSAAGLRRAAEFSWEDCARQTLAAYRLCA